MLCNKRQKNTKFYMNVAWQIMATGTARLRQIDRRMCGLNTSLCDSEKSAVSTSKPTDCSLLRCFDQFHMNNAGSAQSARM